MDIELNDIGEPILPSIYPSPPVFAVALREADGMICGHYDIGLHEPELEAGIVLQPLTLEQHNEAVLSYATHFETDPDLKPVRLEVPQATDTLTVEEKLAAVGLTVAELRQALMS